jgi:hypothetical protein
VPYVHGPNMPKKSFFENELNDAWREAREKGVAFGIALGHKDGTQENDRKGMLYVACEMQDLGCMAPSDIDVAAFNKWREYVMSDRNRRGKAISESGFKKRKEALIVLLKALDLIGPLKVVQQHRSDIRAKEIQYWSREELEAMTRRAMEVFRSEPKRRSRAIAHIIHVIAPLGGRTPLASGGTTSTWRGGGCSSPRRRTGNSPGM